MTVHGGSTVFKVHKSISIHFMICFLSGEPLKWSPPINSIKMIQHSDKMDNNIGAINGSDDLSGLEEGKLQIDEDRNQSSLIEEEDRYQLPDTQNHELQQHGAFKEESRPVDIPVSIHIPEDRDGVCSIPGEPPQLHVNEMSSTVSSPGKIILISNVKVIF